MKTEFDVSVRWVAFPLHPETPEEGRTLEDLFRGRPVDVEQMKARLKQAAQDEGLSLGHRTHTYNSRLAQELGKWAEMQGKGDPYHTGVFRAYFVDGKNIAKIQVLTELAESLELSGPEAKAALESGTFRSAVVADWARSKALGITAVPTFHMNGHTLVGAQPYPVLANFLLDAGDF